MRRTWVASAGRGGLIPFTSMDIRRMLILAQESEHRRADGATLMRLNEYQVACRIHCERQAGASKGPAKY